MRGLTFTVSGTLIGLVVMLIYGSAAGSGTELETTVNCVVGSVAGCFLGFFAHRLSSGYDGLVKRRTQTSSEENNELAKLTKNRTLTLVGAAFVGGSTVLKLAGIFTVGAIPPWGGGILVLFLIGSAIHTSMKIDKLRES